MTTLRKTPALSNNGGVKVNDDTYAEEVNANIVSLWSRNACWLNSVAGTNAITASADVPLTGTPTRPQTFLLVPAANNTGACTLNIDATGNFALNTIAGAPLVSNNLLTTTVYVVIFDGATYRVLNPTTASTGTGVPNAIFADQKAINVAGGTFTAGSFQIRTLNTTIFNTIPGCSLASNQITLPAGNFYLEWTAPTSGNNAGHISRLFNVTGATSVAQSDSNVGGTLSTSKGRAKISPSGSTVYRIEHFCNNTVTSNGFGQAANVTGTIEQYTVVAIWGPF